MAKIQRLPQHVIAKIAAGEVIERPAYAVKELIENAIDANADYITIQIEDAGLTRIIITDNGEGMSFNDLQESIKPHTTSKILTEDDLYRISSLGFRGEALASIAAVSSLTMKSRISAEPTGTVMQLYQGNMVKLSPAGGAVGTTIAVNDLFSNVPARKKFLKSLKTEFRHIVETVLTYSLAFPAIRFFLTHNKKVVLDLKKSQSIDDRVGTVFGKDTKSNMIPVSFEDSYVKITGFIGKPQVATYYSSKQFIFVNKRYVTDKSLTLRVKEAYGNLLESKAYPVFVLFLDLPYETVDVNVHPRKDQVSFVENNLVTEFVSAAVKEALQSANLTFRSSRLITDPMYDTETKKIYSPRSGNMSSFAGTFLKDSMLPWSLKDIRTIKQYHDFIQIRDVYILTQNNDGLLLIDQHAAHERILYEHYAESLERHSAEPNMLSKEFTVELSPAETLLLEEYTPQMQKLGFWFELVERNTFRITRIPSFFKDTDIKKVFLELMSKFPEDRGTKGTTVKQMKLLSYLACRSAIKAGDILTKEQSKKLIEKLAITPNNATCPHARPTKIVITFRELDRLFRRG